MFEPRIQLWTDDSSSEFAIFINSNCTIRTNQEVKYTKIVDESVCLQGFSYDWKHTLSQLVTYLFGNQIALPDKLGISNLQQVAVTDQNKNELKRVRVPQPHNSLRIYNKTSTPKTRPTLKPKLVKYNFCNLKFYIDEERNEHEIFWHNNK
jgi:hypothetical protein